jgi:hypothetical protein
VLVFPLASGALTLLLASRMLPSCSCGSFHHLASRQLFPRKALRACRMVRRKALQ